MFGLATGPAHAAIDWNDDRITWRDLQEGLQLAKSERRLAVVVLYANWCATCHAYRRIFENQTVLDSTAEFVMIRVDADAHPEINRRFAYDGLYLPRVFLLAPDGEVLSETYTANQPFRYFIRPDQPDVLSSLMRRAVAGLVDKK